MTIGTMLDRAVDDNTLIIVVIINALELFEIFLEHLE